jgi:hypothetical protein
MTSPNTFLIGTARAGTTTIAEIMKLQDDFFVPAIKEPKTLAIKSHSNSMKGIGDNFYYKNKPRDIHEYSTLFSSSSHSYRVDASTSYLYYYKESIENIKKVNRAAKILIVLRNPVARAASQYGLMVRDGRESLSFEAALQEESSRISSGWEYAWHYRMLGFYYLGVKAYLEAFDDVNIIIFEELFESGSCNLKMLGKSFDGYHFISPDVRENSSGAGYGRYVSILKNTKLGEFLRAKLSGGVKRHIKKYVKRNIAIEIPSEIKSTLSNEYCTDIIKLEALIGRSTGWL